MIQLSNNDAMRKKIEKIIRWVRPSISTLLRIKISSKQSKELPILAITESLKHLRKELSLKRKRIAASSRITTRKYPKPNPAANQRLSIARRCVFIFFSKV
jgi:hypothetical protein